MLAKVAFVAVFSICLFGNSVPVLAEETDDLCKTFCTDKEKFGDKYKEGRMKSSDEQCDKKETEEDLCCCK